MGLFLGSRTASLAVPLLDWSWELKAGSFPLLGSHCPLLPPKRHLLHSCVSALCCFYCFDFLTVLGVCDALGPNSHIWIPSPDFWESEGLIGFAWALLTQLWQGWLSKNRRTASPPLIPRRDCVLETHKAIDVCFSCPCGTLQIPWC